MASYPFLSQERASEIAEEIYKISQQCLMAHSIRAAEAYLTIVYGAPHHIVLIPVRTHMTGVPRKSHCHPGVPKSRIYVMDNLEHDEKRFCIAHELYHLIVFARTISDLTQPADQAKENILLEQICDIFAHDLCQKHDKFYRDPSQIEGHCQFRRLNFNSLEGLAP